MQHLKPMLMLMTCFICGCASAPKEAAQESPPPVDEYQVPLIMADGAMDEITVEDNKPHEGLRIIFCKELPGVLACLANRNGKQEWLTIPFGEAPRDPKEFT